MEDYKQLKELYYNSKSGLTNSKKFYLTAKEYGLNFSHKQIDEFVKKQNINQVFKPIQRQEKYSTITVSGVRSEFQMDIMVYDRYQYHHYQYIYVIVDIHSRYACARAMTNRENATIMRCMIDMFKVMGIPQCISCDNEFDSIEFRKYCIEHNIKTKYSEPGDILKNSIVERLNRTLAGYIKKMRVGSKVYDWPSHLPDIMDNYNNSEHRTIRNTPFNIFFKNGKNKQDVVVVPRYLEVGDSVRIAIKKKVFDKGDIERYSREVFKIIKIEGDKYVLDNDESYPGRKLQKVDGDVEFDDIPEEKSEEEKVYLQEKKERNISRKLKQVGINPDNVIEGPRVRKQKIMFDM